MKPDKYPLPWCDKYDIPYYQVNLWLICNKEGWRNWQAHKPMSEIIPEIDKLIEMAEKLENCN